MAGKPQESEREGGAWIGQRPDDNTEKVREDLLDDAERVAVTDNTSSETTGADQPDQQPTGHREPDAP
jgi:hypothetical protein